MRLLTGLYEPDEGKISVSGKHAMLLENDYLYEDKTGLENLKIFGLYFGYYVKDYKKYRDVYKRQQVTGKVSGKHVKLVLVHWSPIWRLLL